MTDSRFSGVLAPVITPFKKDLAADESLFIAHCKWVISQGAGLAVFGTNSEANSLSVGEKIDLLDQLVSAGVDPSNMMPGTGCCAITDSIRLTSHAVTLGCRGTLMLPPFYYKGVSDDGLYAFYSELIERVGEASLKIYLYHIPPVSQVPLSLKLIERLVAAYPNNVVGIKDSSGDWNNTRALNDMGLDDFRVFCGSESFLLQNMHHGGAGCISATANVNPAAIKKLVDQWSGPGAENLQNELNDIRNIFQAYPMIAALKAATSIYTDVPDWLTVRPPLVQLEENQLEDLRNQLKEAKFSMENIREPA